MSDAPRLPTEAEFAAWLKARQNKRVGYPRSQASCPLAKCFRSYNKGQRLGVVFAAGKAYVAKEKGGGIQLGDPLPQWAADFADYFDIVAEDGPATGEYALAFLENSLNA